MDPAALNDLGDSKRDGGSKGAEASVKSEVRAESTGRKLGHRSSRNHVRQMSRHVIGKCFAFFSHLYGF